MESVTSGIPDGAIPIKDREAYYACVDGRIYSTRTNIFLKPQSDEKGYLYVRLPRLNRQPGEDSAISIKIAPLICTAFHGEKPDNQTVSHLNGNVQDNRAENLAWEPFKKNNDRKYEHGTMPIGFKNGRAKLTPRDIACIIAWNGLGVSQRAIAKVLGVDRQVVSRVLKGESYPQRVNHEGEIPDFPIM